MRFQKLFLLFFCLLYGSPFLVLYAEIKPTAMLLPIRFEDFPQGGVRKALNNLVRSELAIYYELRTEKEVKQAQEAAVDKISSKDCTEGACIKAMGDILDVEYTFILEVIKVGGDWQLNMERTGQDGIPDPRNELCKSCDLEKAGKLFSAISLALRPGGAVIKRGKASLRIESVPRAQLLLDGREQGKTPLNLSVEARKPVEVMLIAEGYNDFTEIFTLKPGEKRKKKVTLARRRGRIRLETTPPGAELFIDGKQEIDVRGKTVKTPLDLRLVYGKHKIKLTHSGYLDYAKTININQLNLGIKKWQLTPLPGRLIVRVPSAYKNAVILLDGKEMGKMGGRFFKTFEIPANLKHTIQARDNGFSSATQTVQLKADGSKKIELGIFTEDNPKSAKKNRNFVGRSSNFAKNRLGFLTLPSFTDNGDGTISDSTTGLIWQKKDDGTVRTWKRAKNYCDGLSLGGRSDWRLPDDRELSSIIDYGRSGLAIDTSYFSGTHSSHYWSSTIYASYTSNAWGVYFYNGNVSSSNRSNRYYVRCVRGKQ